MYSTHGPTSAVSCFAITRGDLHDVIEIVRHPRRQKLAHRHASQRGVFTRLVQIAFGQVERRERLQV